MGCLGSESDHNPDLELKGNRHPSDPLSEVSTIQVHWRGQYLVLENDDGSTVMVEKADGRWVMTRGGDGE
jgi:hypothetical protein